MLMPYKLKIFRRLLLVQCFVDLVLIVSFYLVVSALLEVDSAGIMPSYIWYFVLIPLVSFLAKLLIFSRVKGRNPLVRKWALALTILHVLVLPTSFISVISITLLFDPEVKKWFISKKSAAMQPY